jgi:hypothetical protein
MWSARSNATRDKNRDLSLGRVSTKPVNSCRGSRRMLSLQGNRDRGTVSKALLNMHSDNSVQLHYLFMYMLTQLPKINYEWKSKIIRTFVFPIYLHESRGWTRTSFFYIVSFLFDTLGPAVHKLAYSFHEEGFRLVAQPFMHSFPPRRLVRIAGFRFLASKSL